MFSCLMGAFGIPVARLTTGIPQKNINVCLAVKPQMRNCKKNTQNVDICST